MAIISQLGDALGVADSNKSRIDAVQKMLAAIESGEVTVECLVSKVTASKLSTNLVSFLAKEPNVPTSHNLVRLTLNLTKLITRHRPDLEFFLSEELITAVAKCAGYADDSTFNYPASIRLEAKRVLNNSFLQIAETTTAFCDAPGAVKILLAHIAKIDSASLKNQSTNNQGEVSADDVLSVEQEQTMDLKLLVLVTIQRPEAALLMATQHDAVNVIFELIDRLLSHPTRHSLPQPIASSIPIIDVEPLTDALKALYNFTISISTTSLLEPEFDTPHPPQTSTQQPDDDVGTTILHPSETSESHPNSEPDTPRTVTSQAAATVNSNTFNEFIDLMVQCMAVTPTTTDVQTLSAVTELHSAIVNALLGATGAPKGSNALSVADALLQYPKLDETTDEETKHSITAKDVFTLEFLLGFLEHRVNAYCDQPRDTYLVVPILTLLLSLSQSNKYVRHYFRIKIIPPRRDVQVRPESGDSLKAKLVRFMTSVTSLKNLAAGFLYILCRRSVDRLIKYTGFGNAAGMLADFGLLPIINQNQSEDDGALTDDSDTEEYAAAQEEYNPVIGAVDPRTANRIDPFEGMSDEQKEYEALKLVNEIDKLISNPNSALRPARVGADGKLEAIEHVLQLQEPSAAVTRSSNQSDNGQDSES